jgi:hypothetical protein
VKHLRAVLRYAAGPALLIAVSSCGDRSVSAPDGGLRHQRRAASSYDGMSVTRGTLVKRTFTIAHEISATATITPTGGMLSLPEAGLLLYFPEGAVSTPLTVTATALVGNRVAYNFEPHGTVFNTPIYVAQELLDTELNTPRARKQRPDVWAGYLANGAADILSDGSANFTEVFDAFYYGKGNDTYAIFTTAHFSGYAMASGRRELVTEVVPQ